MSELRAAPLLDETTNEETENTEEPTPKLRHWRHPTDPTLFWCGKSTKKIGYPTESNDSDKKANCPMCVDMHRRFPGMWWWNTHNMYYESRCCRTPTRVLHDCAAAHTYEAA